MLRPNEIGFAFHQASIPQGPDDGICALLQQAGILVVFRGLTRQSSVAGQNLELTPEKLAPHFTGQAQKLGKKGAFAEVSS